MTMRLQQMFQSIRNRALARRVAGDPDFSATDWLPPVLGASDLSDTTMISLGDSGHWLTERRWRR